MMKILHKARESLSKITSTVVVTGMVAYTNVAFALENEHADDFKTLYDQLLGWAGGTLGKSIALLFLLIGLVEDVRNFGSKDIIGASNPGLYHDHENNQYQHETQIS